MKIIKALFNFIRWIIAAILIFVGIFAAIATLILFIPFVILMFLLDVVTPGPMTIINSLKIFNKSIWKTRPEKK